MAKNGHFFMEFWPIFGRLVNAPKWSKRVQNGPFLDHPRSRTWIWPQSVKMSTVGQNSMKRWPFFAIILPWMASCGSEKSFLLIISARGIDVFVNLPHHASEGARLNAPQPHFWSPSPPFGGWWTTLDNNEIWPMITVASTLKFTFSHREAPFWMESVYIYIP